MKLPGCRHDHTEDDILSAAGRISSARRVRNVAGPGRNPKPTACQKCGEECPSATQARRHCQKPRKP